MEITRQNMKPQHIFVWNSIYKCFILIYINALSKPSISHFFLLLLLLVVMMLLSMLLPSSSVVYIHNIRVQSTLDWSSVVHTSIHKYWLYAQRKTADRGKNCDKKIEILLLLCVPRLHTLICPLIHSFTYNNFYRSTRSVSM